MDGRAGHAIPTFLAGIRDRRRVSAAAASLAAALSLAGCGDGSHKSISNLPAFTSAASSVSGSVASSVSAPSTPSPAAAAGQARVTSGGFIFGLKLDGRPQFVTTITEGAQHFDAPPGKKFLSVGLTVTNVTTQQEPLTLELTSTSTNRIAFAVPLAETGAFGEAPGANQECVESSFSAELPTGLCALATTTNTISPGSDGGQVEMSPGGTERVVVSFGPMSDGAPIADAAVYAIGDNPPAVRIN